MENEDYVIKILNHYLELAKNKEQENYKNLSWDEYRLQFDNDAKYYFEEIFKKQENLKKEALNADTIISFWTPYCRLLSLEAGWNVYNNKKNVVNLTNLIRQINNPHKNKYTPKINEINKKINEFAKVYYTQGNYMLLPKREMNNQRFRITEDRIDSTLYECFDKGALAKFFNSNEELSSWIMEEKLNIMFKDNKILKENLEWFIPNEDKPKWISEMNVEEIYKYLKKATEFINKRNEIYLKENILV
ncbi:MAG: hypothetical protein SPE00_03805 [Bacilli bacterium]|nr:hypothetical protein [Bacilli bacterium]